LLFHYIDASAAACEKAMIDSTKTKRDCAWKCWNSFLVSIGIHNSLYLDGMSKFQKNIIMSAFSQAVRDATFSPRNNGLLVEGTVSATVSYVAQAFRSNNRSDPRLDNDGKTCFLLNEQSRGYRNQDGSTKKQKALPLMVLRKMINIASTPLDKAISHLLIGALFFAMRSCKYLNTNTNEEKKRTKLLRLHNIKFKKEGNMVPFSSSILRSADLVIITFEFQKNMNRN
jgi:hypothetical protein